jgi:nucleoside-diphosphate-sugar epimerase
MNVNRYTCDDNIGGYYIYEPPTVSSSSQSDSTEVVQESNSSSSESSDNSWSSYIDNVPERNEYRSEPTSYSSDSLNGSSSSSWGTADSAWSSYIEGVPERNEYRSEPESSESSDSRLAFGWHSGGYGWHSVKNDLTPDEKPSSVVSKESSSHVEGTQNWEDSTAKAASFVTKKIKQMFWGNVEAEKPQEKEKPKQDVCIIPGGTGHLGREYVLEAMQRGYRVVVVTRNTQGYENTENLQFVQASLDQQSKSEFWKGLVGQYSEVAVSLINTLGAPSAPEGKTLRDVNVLPAVAMAAAMKEMEDTGDLQNSKFVHLSSIGALILENDPYGKTKKESEELVLKNSPKNTCILRVGYAFQKAVEGEINKIDNTHAYSPEQLATMIFQPVLGSGKQLLQPVFSGDIVKAGLNFKEGVKVVNAVGHEILTQENLIGYFCELADKPFRPIHVPTGVARVLTRLAPLGHFQEYAVEGCEILDKKDMILDSKEFEELIGHQTSTLNDVYGDLKGKPLFYAKPPIKEHAVKMADAVGKLTFSNSEETRDDLIENYNQI